MIERLNIEQHLNFADYRCRAYIVNRLRTLSQGSYLAQFRWNGGQSWEGRPWNHEDFPTDAHLVMTLFIHYMDEALRGRELGQSSLPFSSQYYLSVGNKPGLLSKRIQIKQGSKWPPHYQLIVDKTIHDIFAGRNNVFQVIGLFVFSIDKVAGGYIGCVTLKCVDRSN